MYCLSYLLLCGSSPPVSFRAAALTSPLHEQRATNLNNHGHRRHRLPPTERKQPDPITSTSPAPPSLRAPSNDYGNDSHQQTGARTTFRPSSPPSRSHPLDKAWLQQIRTTSTALADTCSSSAPTRRLAHILSAASLWHLSPAPNPLRRQPPRRAAFPSLALLQNDSHTPARPALNMPSTCPVPHRLCPLPLLTYPPPASPPLASHLLIPT
mmetsp:Transcript_390/g.775  ORF Transcript_390/g.775 Transcript_390/m.775 type:complete len:211 (-) Transcript_390:212-844(-)